MKGILITGGSGGIGSSLVARLRAAGFEVHFTFRSGEKAARQLEAEHSAHPIHYDSSNPESREALCQAVRAGELEGLVNLAADRVHRQSIFKLDTNAMLSAVQSNLAGPIQLCQAFAQRCREQNRAGAIVNVLTSYVLALPPPKMLGYILIKYALLGATRALAVELAPYDIRVNAVSPGLTRTDYLSDLPERFLEMAEQDLPFKRLATPGEVSAAIAFLLSPEAAYIHGANIPITGGVAC